MSAIRPAYEAGRHEEALTLARQLADELQAGKGRVLLEPFLAPHPSLDGMLPAEDEVAWSQSLALVAVERMRRWSCFFTAAQSTHLWRELSVYPWWSDEAERMLGTLRQLWDEEAMPDSDIDKIENP